MLHPQREAARALASSRGKADELEHLVDATRREAIAPRQPQQMASRAPPRMRRVCVEQRADFAERGGQIAVPSPAHACLAGVGCVQSEKETHRRRLPGAVRPHEPGDAARLDPEREVVDGDCSPVTLGETVRFDGGAHREQRYEPRAALSSRSGAVFAVRPEGDGSLQPSPSRGTRNLAGAADASRCRARDNGFVSTTQRDPIDELADAAARAAKRAQRVLEGPDGPLAFALVLGLLAMAEVTIYADDIGAAMIANLLATLPLALARRHVAWATGAIVFGVLLAIAADGSTLTIAALGGLVVVLYLFASTYGRRWSVLPALPFLVNAIEPFSGDDAGLSSVLLLMVVVAAAALGDSRRQRGEALAERDETRKAMVDTLQDRAAMEERARIARDLHDVVAHHVSAIAVQAESARLTTEGLPEEGRAHFESIGQTARDALTEMRRLLGVLREDASGRRA